MRLRVFFLINDQNYNLLYNSDACNLSVSKGFIYLQNFCSSTKHLIMNYFQDRKIYVLATNFKLSAIIFTNFQVL